MHSTNTSLDKIKNLPPKPRGHRFEEYIMSIFEKNDMLITSRYRTKDGQQEIDGAINIYNKVFLIEAKWENSKTLAASKLFSFIGKINSKIDGTLGLFISFDELSTHFIDAVRNGIRQNCMVIHGEENIRHLVSDNFELKQYLEYCFIQASIKQRVDVPAAEFLSLPIIKRVKEEEVSSVAWLEIYKALTDELVPLPKFAAQLEAYYGSSLRIGEKLLNIYTTLAFTPALESKFELLIKKMLLSQESQEFLSITADHYKSERWKTFADGPLPGILKKQKVKFNKMDRESITNNVIPVLSSGDYDDENRASRVIDVYYDQLEDDELKDLADVYLDIYVDNVRYEKFEQKQFAKKLFHDLKSRKDFSAFIEPAIIETIRSMKAGDLIFFEEGEDSSRYKRITVEKIMNRYLKVLKDAGFTAVTAKEYVEKKYDEL